MNKLTIITMLLLIGGGCVSSPAEPVKPVVEPVITTETQNNKSVNLNVNIPLTEETTPSAGVARAHTSVMDYFLAIPDEYLAGFPASEREASVDVLDEANYYLNFRPANWDGMGSLAVFLVDDRELVVVERSGCGPVCEQTLYVLEMVNGKWVDQTAKLWPNTEPTSEEVLAIKTKYAKDNPDENFEDLTFSPLVEIPEFGTELKAYDNISGYVYAKIKWNGNKFALTRVATVAENLFE